MKLSGPLTVIAGALLAGMTLVQAGHLAELNKQALSERLRAETRGFSVAMVYRMERDLFLGDHNRPSLQRALDDITSNSPLIETAALLTTEGELLAGSRKNMDSAETLISRVLASRPEELPVTADDSAHDLISAGCRLQLESRKMVLITTARLERSPQAQRNFFLSISTLIAGLSAAMLLTVRGLLETMGRPRSPRL